MVPRLCFALVLILLACSGSDDGVDAGAVAEREVDLNTAIGRGETPSATTREVPPIPTSTVSTNPSAATSSTIAPAPSTGQPTSTSTDTAPATTSQPCAMFDSGAVRLTQDDTGWQLVGAGGIASASRSLDERTWSLLGGLQLDDDPAPELVVQAVEEEGPISVIVYDAVGCDLVAVADALTGEVVEFQVGVADVVAGGMICDGFEVIDISLSRVDLVDSEGLGQVRWEGEAWARTLFSGLWERDGPTELTVLDDDLLGVATLECPIG